MDETGRPIKGATIFVVSTNGSPPQTIGQTTTDENGSYEFRDAPLPLITSSKPADQSRAGCFQVFGKAPGRGFAWRGMKFLHVSPMIEKVEPQLRESYRKNGFFAGDKIELDLTLAPAARIHGRFVDDGGKPIAGVKVQLGKCDFVDPRGKEDHINFREFWAIWQAADAMPDQVLATSDADGLFEFKSVPPEIFCWVYVEHPDYAGLTFYTSTATSPPASHDNRPVVRLPIAMTLYPTRTIPILVQLSDTGQPISGVEVFAGQPDYTGYSSRGISDKDGKLTLRLPAGNYDLQGDPPSELDYIHTSQNLVVEQSPGEQPTTLQIQPGCVLLLRAIDADTGAGIPDVTFGYEKTEQRGGRLVRGRWGVQSHTTKVDNPKTNADGELRAVVPPGVRNYNVGFTVLPKGYQAVKSEDARPGRLLDLPAGKTIKAEFMLRKIAE